jgi:hypothetical protein
MMATADRNMQGVLCIFIINSSDLMELLFTLLCTTLNNQLTSILNSKHIFTFFQIFAKCSSLRVRDCLSQP